MAMEFVTTATYGGQFSSAATFTVPATAKAGDVAFVAVQFNNLNQWITTPSGWTLLAGPHNGTVTASYLFARELGASDPGNPSVFTLSGSASRVVGAMSIWRGVDLSKVRFAAAGGTTRSSGHVTGIPVNQIGEQTQAIAFWMTADPYSFANQYTMGGGATLHALDAQQAVGSANPVLQAIASHRIPLIPTTGYTSNERLSISNASGGTTYATTFIVLVPEAPTGPPTIFGTYADRAVERKFYGSIPKPGPVVLEGKAAPAVLTTARPAGTLQTPPITLTGVLAPRVTAQEFLGRIGYKPRIISLTGRHIDRAFERRMYGRVLQGANPVITGTLAPRPDEREFGGALVAGPSAILGIAAERVMSQDFYGKIEAGATIGGVFADRPVVTDFFGEMIALPPTLRGEIAERVEREFGIGAVFAFGLIRYRRNVQAVLARDDDEKASLGRRRAAAQIGRTKA